MKAKKTEVLTIRLTPETKSAIDKAAQEREWSLSKMAEKILTTWAMQQSELEQNDPNFSEQR